MAEQIEIILSADASDVTAELQKAENNLKKFQAALKKATSVGEINYLTNNIKALEQQINSLNQTNQKFAAGSNKAAYALNDLSRIAQDAPYGFIGIQNNINPLLESFQRLKAESGSTGGALKSMASALGGPAGLGLAVGVASALMVAFGDKLFKAGENVNHLTDVFSKMNLELTILQQSLKDTLTELNNIKQIQDLEIRLKITGLGAAADYRREVAKLGITQLNLVEQQSYVVQSLDDQKEAFDRTSNILKKTIRDSVGAFTSLTAGNPVDNQIKALGGLDKAYLFTDEQIKKFDDDVRIALTNYRDQQIAIRKTNEDLRKLQFEYKLAGIELKVLNQIHKETIASLNKKNEVDLKLNIKPVKVEKIELDPTAGKNAEQKLYYWKQHLGKITIPIFPVIDIENLPLPDQKWQIDVFQEYNDFLQNAAYGLGTNFAEVLATAMTEGISFGDAFKGVMNGLGKAVQGLGEDLIKVGTMALVAKIALDQLLVNPYAAIAAGIALAALGSMLQKTTKQKRFAVGTRNAPGGMSLVGERGPELVNIPRGASVIPAAQTSNMMGGMGGAVEVFGVLRGQDIYFSNKKYGLSYGRQT